jgi:hypothetical protein
LNDFGGTIFPRSDWSSEPLSATEVTNQNRSFRKNFFSERFFSAQKVLRKKATPLLFEKPLEI